MLFDITTELKQVDKKQLNAIAKAEAIISAITVSFRSSLS